MQESWSGEMEKHIENLPVYGKQKTNVPSQGKISVSFKRVKKYPAEKQCEASLLALQLNWHSTRTLCSKKKTTLLEVDSDSMGEVSCAKPF